MSLRIPPTHQRTEDQAMSGSGVEVTRATSALRRAVLPLLVGGGFCLVILLLGQWPQACNGVQVCPPLTTRPNTAILWFMLTGVATVVAMVVRVALPRWVGRLAIGVLAVAGLAGALFTLFATGF